jgi:hypothetical protein
VKPQNTRKRPTISSVARLMNCPYSAVRRVLNCLKMGNPVSCLNWCRGRPRKMLNLNQEQIAWITSRQTLRRQAGKNLKTRTMIVNRRFGSNIKFYDLRKIYKMHKITIQKMRSQVKPSRQFPVEEQLEKITKLQNDFMDHLSAGKEIVQYDECVFSVNSYKKEHFAPSGYPLKTK